MTKETKLEKRIQKYADYYRQLCQLERDILDESIGPIYYPFHTIYVGVGHKAKNGKVDMHQETVIPIHSNFSAHFIQMLAGIQKDLEREMREIDLMQETITG